MPRYFFHVHDGVSFPDDEGTELRDLHAARAAAVTMSGEMLKAWSPEVGYPVAEQQVVDGTTIVQCENGSIAYRPGGKAVVRFS